MHKLRSILIILSLFILPVLSNSVGDACAQKKTTTSRRTSSKRTSSKRTAVKIDKKTQLRNEKEATVRARKAAQQQAIQLGKHVKANLDSVMILDNRIGRQRVSIDSLGKEIHVLGNNIIHLSGELDTLEANLVMRKKHYAKALVHMRRNRSMQSKLMFIFSANNFTQLIRRFRYMREYSTFQKAQAKIIREQQALIKKKKYQLQDSKTHMETNRKVMWLKQKSMESMKSTCEVKVQFLNKNIATVQQQIKDYQQKEASLDAEIERVIQAEIEAARRAEAERQRKAAEAKAKAEAAKRERARKLAEAKAAQERARARAAEAEAKRKAAEAARKAARSEEEKAAAKAAEAEAKLEAERAKENVKTADAEAKVVAKEEKAAAKAEKKAEKATIWSTNEADVKLSNLFANNRGRLPMPVTGSYQVVGHYGNYTPTGLSGVVLNNKGIDIRGQQGSQARAIFDGEVSKIFQYAGRFIVMVRHGSYISVYSGLSSVCVSQGQKVSTKSPLGTIGANSDGNYVLQFQLRNESSRLNPEQWVR